MGSETIGSGSGLRVSSRAASPPNRRLRLGSETMGVVGLPSLIQPCSSAAAVQSAQTSTHSSPPGVKRTARSPMRRVRWQMAHVR
jgi:hypothetical protein